MKLILLFLIFTLTSPAAPPLPSPIAFYVVSETKISGTHYIDTPTLPKIGYVGAPALVVTAIASLEKDKSQFQTTTVQKDGTKKIESGEKYSLTITLLPEDTPRFTELTAKIHGERLLIEVAGVPIIAPFIHETIETPVISIGWGDRSEDEKHRDALFDTLKQFLKKP